MVPRQFSAVIFDMDGVLLDSEALYKENNLRFFSSLGMEVSHELYHSFIGTSSTIMWQTLKARFDLPHEIGLYKDLEKEEKYRLLSHTDLQPHETLNELLDHLNSTGIKLGVASMSMKKNILLVLEKLRFTQYFSVILSGEDVVKGKPDPEIYLKASQLLGEDIDSCVVVEDSKNGVAAGRAAGMRCIGYVNPGSGNQDLSQAHFILHHYSEWLHKLKEP